jgi:hypothetical protein
MVGQVKTRGKPKASSIVSKLESAKTKHKTTKKTMYERANLEELPGSRWNDVGNKINNAAMDDNPV